jgi:integrase
LRTGFRILELLLLTWEDVDFRSRVVIVRAVYVKNGKSRSVPMNEVLTTTLQAVRMSIAADGPVFRTRTDTLYRSSRTAFTHAVHQAGMMDFTFHDLRLYLCESVGHGGGDLSTVQALMGHKDISMTLRYTHLSSDHKQRTICVLESFAEKSPAIFPTGGEGRGQ